MDWLYSLAVVFISSCACSTWDQGFTYSYSYEGKVAVGRSPSRVVRIQATLRAEAVASRLLICQLIDARTIALSDARPAIEQLDAKFHVALDVSGSVVSLWYPNGTNVTHSAINYHKALASLLNLRLPIEDAAHPVTYSSMQDEVTGRCENVYDWSPATGPSRNCPGSGYQLYKTRNFDRCAQLPMYNVMAPSGWRCHPSSAACESAQSRSLVQRMDLCKTADGVVEIVFVESREDWISLSWGVKHQPYSRIEIVQRLQLTAKRRGVATKEAERSPTSLLHSPIFAAEVGTSHDSAAELTLNKIRELDRIVFEPPELVQRRPSLLRKELLASFRSFSSSTLTALTEKAYQQLSPQQWSLYVQHVATVGSAVSLDAVKLLIEQERVSTRDALGIISGFSMFLREASDHVLAQLLSMLDVGMVRREARLRQTAMVSLASFFRTACVDRLAAEARFPLAWPFTVTSRKPTDYWPSRLVSRLALEIDVGDSADRSAALSALNIIGHPSLIPVVIPIIEGKIDANPTVRTKAVLALHKLAHRGNADAIWILHTVFANPSENYQVRMGAFTLLMLSNPPDHVWQGVAARTWFEPRIQVASFVYTTLETLASFRSPLRFLQRLSQQAKKVLPLARPISHERSANFVWSYEQKRRLLAGYLRLETFANKASEFPKEIYGRLNVNLGAIDFDLLEFEMHGHHVESLLAEMLGHEASRIKTKCRRLMSAPVDHILQKLNVTYHAEDPSEGYIRWTLAESYDNFWSFDIKDAQKIAAAMGSADLIGEKIEWYQEWPLVNVELRWPNSMGFLNEVLVTGRITATLNGYVHLMNRVPLVLDTQLRPTVALALDSEFGVRMGRSQLSVNSSVLLLGSLPGRTSVRLGRQLELQWSSGAPDALDNHGDEMIFLHKGECTDGSCPAPKRLQLDGHAGGHLDAEEILSAFSFAWLPGSALESAPRQLSLDRSAPVTFQLTVHLDVNETLPIGWIMKSGTSELLRSTSSATSTTPTPGGRSTEPLIDFSDSREPPAIKPIGLSAPSTASSPPPRLELPAQMARALLALARGLRRLQKSEQQSSMEAAASSGGRFELEWTSPEKSGSCVTTVEKPAAAHFGECHINSTVVDTFDGVAYEPKMRLGCQYVAAAATGRDDKFAILLDRRDQIEALKIVVTQDDVVVNATHMTLTVNQIEIPLESGSSEAFLLADECFGSLILARKIISGEHGNKERLIIELPFHGIILEILSPDNVIIKAKESLRGRLQGLCGDMNGETLFEFRGPQRCVLSSGALMTEQYQTSSDTQCLLPPAAAAAEADSCPRQEGSPTIIRYPSSARPLHN